MVLFNGDVEVLTTCVAFCPTDLLLLLLVPLPLAPPPPYCRFLTTLCPGSGTKSVALRGLRGGLPACVGGGGGGDGDGLGRRTSFALK